MTKKSPKAVSLKYGKNKAPIITAKGEGAIAQDIIELAKEHGILIHQDEELTKFLGQMELGDQIPKELYVLIAELIAFSYLLQGKFPEHWQNMHKRIDHKI